MRKTGKTLSRITNKMEQCSVLIVGAGPVGLITALRLSKAGIAVTVIEKEAALNVQPRAVGYYGAGLTALYRAGVLGDMVKEGFVSKGLCWRKPLANDGKGGKRLGDIIARLPSPSEAHSPHGVTGTVNLPQSELSKLLYRQLMATGNASVHFNTTLDSIVQHEDHVLASTTSSTDMKTVQYRALFLVGADGGKSTTRKLLGIPLKGHSWPEYILATDVLVETTDTNPEYPSSIIVDPVHYGIITPLQPFEVGKKTLYRCSVGMSASDSSSPEKFTEEPFISDILLQMLPGARPLDIEIVKKAPYKIHQLCASTFRRGRCVLVGDAAHLNNPLGAMGLNTGLIDSDALADTLELIINEGESIDLLTLYSHERQKAFQFFVDPQSTQNKLRLMRDPETAHEDWLFSQMANPNPDTLANYGRAFQEQWRTDMRALVRELKKKKTEL